MNFGNPRSRPLIPGLPGAPAQLEEQDLAMIPFLIFFEEPAPDDSCYRGTTVAAASDQEFDVWIEHMYSRYLLDEAERHDTSFLGARKVRMNQFPGTSIHYALSLPHHTPYKSEFSLRIYLT